MVAAGIDAVLILQTAGRHHDGRIRHVGPVGFDVTIWLRAFGRRGGADTGQGTGNERHKSERSYRRCWRGVNSFHRISNEASLGRGAAATCDREFRIDCRRFAERRFIFE